MDKDNFFRWIIVAYGIKIYLCRRHSCGSVRPDEKLLAIGWGGSND